MNYFRLVIVLLAAFCSVNAYCEEAITVDFTLEDINGDLFELKEFVSSGPVLLDFWATWCKPCKDAMPHLQKLHEDYGEQGLTIAAISIDSPRSQSKIKPFIKSRRYTFKVLLDPSSEVLQLFQGSNIPFQVLIDRDGKVINTHTGYSPGDEKILEVEIRKLLSKGTTEK